MVNRHVRKQLIYRFNADRSLLVLAAWNPVRQLAAYVGTHQVLEFVVVATVVANAVLLAINMDNELWAQILECARLHSHVLLSINRSSTVLYGSSIVLYVVMVWCAVATSSWASSPLRSASKCSRAASSSGATRTCGGPHTGSTS